MFQKLVTFLLFYNFVNSTMENSSVSNATTLIRRLASTLLPERHWYLNEDAARVSRPNNGVDRQ